MRQLLQNLSQSIKMTPKTMLRRQKWVKKYLRSLKIVKLNTSIGTFCKD